MCTPWRVVLLLLALIPHPGVSQIGAQRRNICTDCPSIKKDEEPALFQRVMDATVKEYRKCAHTTHIRLMLGNEKREIICAEQSLSWVQKLMDCHAKGWKCLDTSSNSQKEFSKGPNEKPSTTTVKAPTTVPLTSMKPSTQTWDHNIGHSTEPTEAGEATPTASPVTTRRSDILSPDSNKTHINSQQGDQKSSQDPMVEDVGSKMKHMQTAVISLIAIVLVVVAVAVGLYCRKKKKNKFNSPCGGNPIAYTAAPSEDSFVMVGAE